MTQARRRPSVVSTNQWSGTNARHVAFEEVKEGVKNQDEDFWYVTDGKPPLLISSLVLDEFRNRKFLFFK